MIFGKFRGPDTTERMFLGRREKEMRDVIKKMAEILERLIKLFGAFAKQERNRLRKKDTRKTFSKPETSGFHGHSTKKVKGQNEDNNG